MSLNRSSQLPPATKPHPEYATDDDSDVDFSSESNEDASDSEDSYSPVDSARASLEVKFSIHSLISRNTLDIESGRMGQTSNPLFRSAVCEDDPSSSRNEYPKYTETSTRPDATSLLSALSISPRWKQPKLLGSRCIPHSKSNAEVSVELVSVTSDGPSAQPPTRRKTVRSIATRRQRRYSGRDRIVPSSPQVKNQPPSRPPMTTVLCNSSRRRGKLDFANNGTPIKDSY